MPGAPCTTSECVGAEAPERAGDQRRAGAGDATPMTWRPRARGIRQRPDEVHQRLDRHLAARRPHVPHRRVHRGREHEHDPRAVEHVAHPLHRNVDRDAERLEDVGAAGARRERAVAVLRDPHAGARGEQRRRGRDVERGHRAAAGAARVHESPRTARCASAVIAPRSARAAPASSSGVSPFTRSPMRSAPSCAPVASPGHHRAEGGGRLRRRRASPRRRSVAARP